jgi:hypothetical protein
VKFGADTELCIAQTDTADLHRPISIEIGRYRCHKERPTMTKAELQTALAVATETDKRQLEYFWMRSAPSRTRRLKRMANSSCPVLAS